MAKRPDRALVKVTLRIRERLRKELEAAAKKSGQSLNTEMAERLEQSFAGQDLKDLIKELKQSMAQRDKQIEHMEQLLEVLHPDGNE